VNWREAFIRQARSEQAVRLKLGEAKVEYAHRLHYLQMVCEKLAKAYQIRADEKEPPEFSHKVFVRFLQTLIGRKDMRTRLGYESVVQFRAYIKSLLDVALEVEGLAPSAAGLSRPNPEYPWRDLGSGNVLAPVDFNFPLFDPHNARIVKLEGLIAKLLQIGG
jgi:hypothetical protein